MSVPDLAPVRRFGWKKPVERYAGPHRFAAHPAVVATLPASFDQRTQLGPWPDNYDQGNLSSCTGNGLAALCHYKLVRSGKVPVAVMNQPEHTPSRLFIYRQERVIEGDVAQDDGASIHDGVKALADKGFCFEGPVPTGWPYNEKKYKLSPPSAAWAAATRHRVAGYRNIDNTVATDIKVAVAAGDPVAFGVTLYDSFMNVGDDGLVPMPGKDEKVAGGHCMVIMGWNDDLRIGDVTGAFLVRNSWGKNSTSNNGWGDHGNGWIPMAYLTNPSQADDFWIIDLVP